MSHPPRTSGSSSRPVSPNTRVNVPQPTPPTDVFATPSDQCRRNSSPPPSKFWLIKRPSSTPPETTHENHIVRSSGSTTGALASVSNLHRTWNRQRLSRKRSQYYDGAFACREANNTARAIVARDSLVMAEVKLCCKLEDEQPFLADLSFQLCEIYQRPESSVMVVLTSAPMLVGGNAEPAYHITISALAKEIAPTKNKRSTALLQAWILESLNIPLDRGVIRFEAIAEENLAFNGKTVLQEIEEMESSPNEDDGVLRTISRNGVKMGRKSSVPIFTERGKTPTSSSNPGIPARNRPGLRASTNWKATPPNETTASRTKKYAKSIFKVLFQGPENYERYDPEKGV